MSDEPVALITGAYRGLGFETCRQLAMRGYAVLLTARHDQQGNEAAQTLADEGLDIRYYALDVTDEISMQRLAGHIRQAYGRLDVLVNNAGVFPDSAPGENGSSAFDARLENVRRGLETNTLGPLRLCQRNGPRILDSRLSVFCPHILRPDHAATGHTSLPS